MGVGLLGTAGGSVFQLTRLLWLHVPRIAGAMTLTVVLVTGEKKKWKGEF